MTAIIELIVVVASATAVPVNVTGAVDEAVVLTICVTVCVVMPSAVGSVPVMNLYSAESKEMTPLAIIPSIPSAFNLSKTSLIVAVLSMLMVFRAFPSWSCTIIFEAPVSPTSESLVSKSAYSVLVVKSVLPVDETASVFVIEVIPKAEATVPSSVPPVTTSLPVASIEAEPPFW